MSDNLADNQTAPTTGETSPDATGKNAEVDINKIREEAYNQGRNSAYAEMRRKQDSTKKETIKVEKTIEERLNQIEEREKKVQREKALNDLERAAHLAGVGDDRLDIFCEYVEKKFNINYDEETRETLYETPDGLKKPVQDLVLNFLKSEKGKVFAPAQTGNLPRGNSSRLPYSPPVTKDSLATGKFKLEDLKNL